MLFLLQVELLIHMLILLFDRMIYRFQDLLYIQINDTTLFY